MIEDAVEPTEGIDDDTVEDHEREDEPEGTGDAPSSSESYEPDTSELSDYADTPTPETPAERKKVKRPQKARDKGRPVAYARGLTGADNCAFCIMLASRGAVYKNASTAKFDGDGSLYHDRCDCVAIPVYTSKDWPGKDQADLAYKFWLESTGGYFQGDAIRKFRRVVMARGKDGHPPYPGFKPLRVTKKGNVKVAK